MSPLPSHRVGTAQAPDGVGSAGAKAAATGLRMPRRRHAGRAGVGLGLGLGLAMIGADLWAGPGGGSAAGGLQLDGAQWLDRLRHAALNLNYQGTVVYSAGSVVSSSRLAHHVESGEQYERQEILDGRARLQFRHNDEVVIIWPALKVAVVESRDVVPRFPMLPHAPALKQLDHYELRSAGLDRMAGRDAQVLQVLPRDSLRFAQRWWVDRDSGLMLRSDLLGPQGAVLESSAFTDLQLGGKARPDEVLQPMRRLEGLRLVQGRAVNTSLESEGWSLTRPVPGFAMVSCGKRPLDITTAIAGADKVLQAVFTDGLVHVSVFVERYDRARHKQGMRSTMGGTNSVMHRRADSWLTVVGEVPMATVLQFDSALTRVR